MKLEDFFDAVENDEQLNGVGINEEKGTLLVACGSQLCTELSADIIEQDHVDWDLLRSVLVGDREPDVLYHMSRVVGYFSRLENWSASKIGEFKDRQKGNYRI